MKHIALSVTFIILSVIACRKEASDKVNVVESPQVFGVTDNYTEADEAQFVADDTGEEILNLSLLPI